ncbi:MAG TPA: site-2 protease family protein [Thermoanaerobaculia bacterium]|nr:site-2 protease family protein [Thermoanaerobaculia bacterium]
MVSTVALGLLWYLAFLLSTTLHEAAHAWAALRMGDPTAYHGGQVSLNPIPHIRREPFGMVLVPILVFALSGWMLGWASAPYDPEWADRHPKRSGLMALAGPAANLLLLVLSGAAIAAGIAGGLLAAGSGESLSTLFRSAEAGGAPEAVATFLSILFVLNLILFLFNLLPLPPMDGSGALPLVMSDRLAIAYRQSLRHPGIALAGLLLAWWVFPYLFFPVLGAAVGLLFGLAGGGPG